MVRGSLIALALGFTGAPPASSQEADLVDLGRPLYQDNCVDCHGEDAREGSGGDIRGSNLRTVRKMTTSGLEGMPEFEFSDEELNALVAYLGAL